MCHLCLIYHFSHWHMVLVRENASCVLSGWCPGVWFPALMLVFRLLFKCGVQWIMTNERRFAISQGEYACFLSEQWENYTTYWSFASINRSKAGGIAILCFVCFTCHLGDCILQWCVVLVLPILYTFQRVRVFCSSVGSLLRLLPLEEKISVCICLCDT